jgi:hypothetical protein
MTMELCSAPIDRVVEEGEEAAWAGRDLFSSSSSETAIDTVEVVEGVGDWERPALDWIVSLMRSVCAAMVLSAASMIIG